MPLESNQSRRHSLFPDGTPKRPSITPDDIRRQSQMATLKPPRGKLEKVPTIDLLDVDINATMDEAFSDKSCLKEFCEETSLAGFKYMLPQYGPIFRRLFWSIICLIFSGLTLYQLYLLFASYLRSPLSVIISKSYHDSLKFPAVLLCNTMPFRVSQIRPQSDMHQTLSDLYESPTLNSSIAHRYKELLGTVTDTQEYLEAMAFAKEDMIVRCVWRTNETCSADDFHPVIVGNKICYAFNSGYNGSEVLHTENSGEGNGLELTLNVETYERMQGPYSTYGISVGFFAEGNNPTMQGSIDTLIGAKTKIGLTHKEVYYSKGLTCDDRTLKHHTKYSRLACSLEQQAEKAMNICRCYPFSMPQENMDPNATICDLYQHFACAEPQLANAVNVSEETCPPECFTVLYEATVSQSFIAWDRAQTQLRSNNSDLEHLKNKLSLATEIRHRYDPKSNRTTTALLEKVTLAVKDAEQIVKDINSLYCELSVPMPGQPPPIGQKFKEFKDEFLSSDNDESILPNFKSALASLAQSLTDLSAVFTNEENADLILWNRTQEDYSIKELGYSTNFFTISKDVVYLKSLSKWVSSLDKLKIQQNHVNKTKIVKQMEKVQSSKPETRQSLLPNWIKILPDGEVDDFAKHLSSLTRIGFNKGCLDEPYDVEIEPTYNSTDILLITDVITCIHYNFASNRMKEDTEVIFAKVLTTITGEDEEPQSKSNYCNKLLCQIVEDSNHPRCRLHPDKLLPVIQDVLGRMFPKIMNCTSEMIEANANIEYFISEYENDVLPTFSQKSEEVKDYKDSLHTVKKTLNNEIWPNFILSDLSSIHDNITAYVKKGVPYGNFSFNVTMHFKSWFDNTYMFANNEARTKLNTLITSFNEINKISNIFNATLTGTAGEVHTELTQRSFSVLASELLWQTNTTGKIDEVVGCIDFLDSDTAELLGKLPQVTMQFQLAMLALFKDAEKYLENLEVDTSFYEKNFMAVNIFFNELSKDITKQMSAYNFWSLMADIGGASGLWLGFCMVTLVELFETAVRHCFFKIGKWVYKKNEKTIGKVIANDVLTSWRIGSENKTEDEDDDDGDPDKDDPNSDLPEKKSLLDDRKLDPRID